jgi:hypothetical protein
VEYYTQKCRKTVASDEEEEWDRRVRRLDFYNF